VTFLDTSGTFLDSLTSDAEKALGIHDFYRYGLWGYCDGYNDTVVFCSKPKPGNASNPIAALNADLTRKYDIPLPSNVERDINRLASLSLFIFACWIIGTVLDFGTLVSSTLTCCRSRVSAFIVGIFGLVLVPMNSLLTTVGRFCIPFNWLHSSSGTLLGFKQRHQRQRQFRDRGSRIVPWKADVCIRMDQ
jgi:hypothetical protein